MIQMTHRERNVPVFICWSWACLPVFLGVSLLAIIPPVLRKWIGPTRLNHAAGGLTNGSQTQPGAQQFPNF